jgi:hypothetical protein
LWLKNLNFFAFFASLCEIIAFCALQPGLAGGLAVDNLIARITAARDVAAEREGDTRIREFLRAITIRQDAGGAEHLSCTVSIDCHFRSWHKCLLPAEAAQLNAMSQDELAQTIAGWVQAALKDDLLSLSNPPLQGVAASTNAAVSNVVTFIYDKDCLLVGKKWA